ncbi:hypothetical protein GOQ27_13955 [Clostridium sp. D2Q-11]|uniref:Uncharacterized protein n=1 Tax=Anaeromonas frigoriresistens TaxID=2683708 RepID=A0A942Z9V8_9FIRM|nr:hypothetical protein [Anaeromonas frigoriresistens]MBS4539574.1 hypothetical protein [Anaeromonas frigoriresistens]
MNKNIIIIGGIILIIHGIVLLTRRKFIEKGEFGYIFVMFISMTPLIMDTFEMEYGKYHLLGLLIVITPVWIMLIVLNRENYTIRNIKGEMVKSILIDILNEKDISYEEEKNKLILKNYKNKTIYCRGSFNSVDIKFREIRDLPFYKELKKELKIKIKRINQKTFPLSGLLHIFVGIVFIIIIL